MPSIPAQGQRPGSNKLSTTCSKLRAGHPWIPGNPSSAHSIPDPREDRSPSGCLDPTSLETPPHWGSGEIREQFAALLPFPPEAPRWRPSSSDGRETSLRLHSVLSAAPGHTCSKVKGTDVQGQRHLETECPSLVRPSSCPRHQAQSQTQPALRLCLRPNPNHSRSSCPRVAA